MTEERTQILDELLVLRCQQGSAEAFELLVKRWQAPLWRHAHRLTGASDAAWDVLQEAWMAMTRGLGRLEEPAAFRSWAYTIVSRKAADWRRRRVARGEEEPLTEEPLIPDQSENGAAAALSQALRKLSGERRALINLRYVEGFDVREMARILDIPEGTVKSRLHSARQQIQDIMERSDS